MVIWANLSVFLHVYLAEIGEEIMWASSVVQGCLYQRYFVSSLVHVCTYLHTCMSGTVNVCSLPKHACVHMCGHMTVTNGRIDCIRLHSIKWKWLIYYFYDGWPCKLWLIYLTYRLIYFNKIQNYKVRESAIKTINVALRGGSLY